MEDRIERIRITTRGYEVSPRGFIAPAQFLRYVEHIRWRTIAHSDKIPAREFMRIGVIRAQKLDVFEDVSFDVELEITMWLSRIGKTSLDFSHEVLRVSDGALIARSSATVVTLDSNRRPAAIEPSAQNYVLARPGTVIERLDGAAPAGAFEHPIVVRPSDEDMQGHVNHARYADFVEDTRLLCARAGGYGASSGDFEVPARSLTLSYDEEARVGDPFRAYTYPSTAAPGTIDFLLVKGDGRITTRARVGLFPIVRPDGEGDPR
ncbi:MAG TPA: thioesterase family protein [Polyangiaceae bacterium]|nr:thioesterase family protein [Polyangiaceae bacterium]